MNLNSAAQWLPHPVPCWTTKLPLVTWLLNKPAQGGEYLCPALIVYMRELSHLDGHNVREIIEIE